jgi:hypothetical protein
VATSTTGIVPSPPGFKVGGASGYNGDAQPSYGPVEVKYVLEVWQGSNFRGAITLPHVQSAELRIPETGTVTFTLGDKPIIERYGRRRRDIFVTGRSGVEPRLGQDRYGNTMFARGTDLFREFQRFIDVYQTAARRAQDSRDTEYYMVFRALWERWYFLIEPSDVTITRNFSTTRHSYGYSIRMLGYAETTLTEANSNVFRIIENKSRDISGYIDQATAFVSYSRQWIDQSGAAISSISEPVKAVSRALGQLALVGESIGRFTRIPVDQARYLLDIADKSVDVIEEFMSAIPFGSTATRTRELAREIRSEIAHMQREARIILGGARVQQGPLNVTQDLLAGVLLNGQQLETTTGQLVTAYTVKEGETLRSIAKKFLGDEDKASEIIEVNNLPSYEQDGSGVPIGPGVVLLIPLPEINSRLQIANVEQIYGTDFLLDNDDLLVSNSLDDFALVSGSKLLEQALTVRVLSVRGESVFENFGLVDRIGNAGLLQTTGRISSDVQGQIEADPRINSIDRLTVLDGGDLYEVSCRAIALGSRKINLQNIPISS